MKTIRSLMRTGALAVLVATAALANAAPLTSQTWTLQNVRFDDGTMATGQFTYDASSSNLLSWAITVASGTLPALVYDAADSSFYGRYWGGANEIVIVANDGTTDLTLNFAAALTNGGGTVALLTDAQATDSLTRASWEELLDYSAQRYITSGQVTTESLPEPSSLALCSLAGLGLFAVRRRKPS